MNFFRCINEDKYTNYQLLLVIGLLFWTEILLNINIEIYSIISVNTHLTANEHFRFKSELSTFQFVKIFCKK